jgi:hypothetical protein
MRLNDPVFTPCWRRVTVNEVLPSMRQAILSLLPAAAALAAPDLPVIPLGLDAYRMWEHWPDQRVGVRAYMRSTYDRAGENWAADATNYLYQLAPDKNVTLHVEGPGILYFARYNHWHGSPWLYEVDGVEHLVQESSTADPHHPVENSVFLPEHLFPEPLAWTWSTTRGADLMWVPIPFERSFRMMYGRTYYGTGYYIYHQFAGSASLSQPLRAWDGQTPPDADVLALLKKSATELLPMRHSAEESALQITWHEGQVQVPARTTSTVWNWSDGGATLRAIEFSVPRAQAIDFGQLRLRVTWDGAAQPSIDAPLALFFGAGTLYNRDDREYLVRAFPVQIRFDQTRVHLACVFPMPFERSARIELSNTGDTAFTDVRWAVRRAPLRQPMAHQGHFHATYRDHPNPPLGHDLVLLDTDEVEGGGHWSGHLVGTSWIFSHRGNLTTLEGDPRFFFDGSQTPQAQGTGTEEWGGGGDYWGGLNMSLPLAGHPCGARRPEAATDPLDLIQSAYRFLLADLMPFGRRAVIRLEHGGENQSTEHYETVTYWYGRNTSTLEPTDRLEIGDVASELAHDYQSPEASEPYSIESRYEWGPDTTADGREIFPAHRQTGRTTTGTSEFTLKLRRDNLGVLLRRTLDYWFPNQRAEVSVARVAEGNVGEFEPAGVWFLAGSNTYIFSYPENETAPPRPEIKRSNRRFRDDEFLIQRRLTEGADAIRVRIRFTPANIPLLPHFSLPVEAWSEIRYECFSIIAPR